MSLSFESSKCLQSLELMRWFNLIGKEIFKNSVQKYLAMLHINTVQTVDSLQTFDGWNLQKQPYKMKETKKTENSNRFVPDKTIFFSLEGRRRKNLPN